MASLIERYASKIAGVLSCFDRIVIERHRCLAETFRNAGAGSLVKRFGGPGWAPFAE